MASGDEQHVPSDGSASVVKNDPIDEHNETKTLRDVFNVFARFRRDKNYSGLIQYLITTYPKNVKNRTFNFSGGGHTFHMLYAYVPLVSTKERKQIRLDFIDKLMTKTSNDFKLYEDVIKLMGDNDLDTCPCELINARLQDNIAYNNNLQNKHFDVKPAKLKKEPIDALLSKNSINWKQSLKKKKVNLVKKVKTPPSSPFVSDATTISLSTLQHPTRLHKINGYTVQSCRHEWVVVEKQLRAGDEAVSFVTVCKLCKQVNQ
ncbi:lef-5 [Spodoptera frugiperda granulovirus]|uniref:Lef-5 n=1 Tax=Spodoptera frugiperda granulovirus TaxID=307454 RepID=A0A0C5ASF1_9BBAC|nr:lef-5 [Spodoptera frugiperda granulovirus]AJK91742.1 lef-5 [Spodoptera frugiperda granulovirus]AXS01105.1 lef-5 [Spodoptera frugiperda granulovirus]